MIVDLPAVDDARRRLVPFLAAFACVFGGLALLHGIGPSYTRAHVALGNVLVGGGSSSGATLRFRALDEELATDPWHAVLRIEPLSPERPVEVPIDVRS